MLLYALIPLASIIGLVLLWLAVSYGLSFVGGWHVLGKLYPAREQAGTTDLGTASLTLDRGFIVVNYNRSVHFTVGPEGLGMMVGAFFKRDHPPVTIPWSEVEACAPMKLAMGEGTAITLKGHRVNLLVRGPAAAAVLEAWRKRGAASQGAP